MRFLSDRIEGLKFNILSNNIFNKDGSETGITPPPVAGEFNLLDGTDFLLLDNTNFMLL